MTFVANLAADLSKRHSRLTPWVGPQDVGTCTSQADPIGGSQADPIGGSQTNMSGPDVSLGSCPNGMTAVPKPKRAVLTCTSQADPNGDPMGGSFSAFDFIRNRTSIESFRLNVKS